jgi:hypothetical protein
MPTYANSISAPRNDHFIALHQGINYRISTRTSNAVAALIPMLMPW